MNIYTDGATSFNGTEKAIGGWAYVIIDEEDQIITGDYGNIIGTTNNICEMTAIINGCIAASEMEGTHTVYSDSSYCINCYEQKWYRRWQENGWINSSSKPVANKALWEQLIPFFESEKFIFKKIKGHSTNKWNNYVDKKAVEAKEKTVG